MGTTRASLLKVFALASYVAFGLVAGPTAWAYQTMRITAINGVPVPSGPPYDEYQAYPNEDGYFLIAWESTDTTCGGGVDEYNILIDGVYYRTPVSDGATSGMQEIYPQYFRSNPGDPGSNLESRKNCRHTIRLSDFYMLSPDTNCQYYRRVPGSISDTLIIWTTPRSLCEGPKDSCEKTDYVGGPVDVATGEMHLKRTDLTMKGPIPIELTRRYDSGSTYNGPLEYGWQHSYSMRLETDGSAGRISLVDGDGHRTYFSRVVDTTDQWEPDEIGHLTLTQPPGVPWRVTDKHGMQYDFDGDKRLWKLRDRNGNTLTLTYGSGGRLDAITDFAGRAMTFEYSPDNRHILRAFVGSHTARYWYVGDDLVFVWVYNNDVSNDVSLYQAYHYSPTLPHKLTEVWDYDRLLEAHEYDAHGRVVHTYSDSTNYDYTIAFDAYPATQSTVTNGRGVTTVYDLDAVNGLVLDRTQGPACQSCGGSDITMHKEFDRSLNVTQTVDGRGVVTAMTYDAMGNVLTRTEAYGTALARTTTITYDPNLNLPATISVPTVGTGSCATSRPNKVTTRSYDANGNLLTETVSGCNGDVPFDHTTTFTYDARGRVLTLDGPRVDVQDLTTYEYYPDDQSVPVEKRGRVRSVTNAVGNQTTYHDYDHAGNVLSETDANAIETTYQIGGYDQVLEIRIKGASPAEDIITWPYYDGNGNLERLWNPICAQRFEQDDCEYSYIYQFDEGNRLKQVQDIYGNAVRYTYDVEGNKTREEHLDPNQVTRRATNFAYDGFNRLQQRRLRRDAGAAVGGLGLLPVLVLRRRHAAHRARPRGARDLLRIRRAETADQLDTDGRKPDLDDDVRLRLAGQSHRGHGSGRADDALPRGRHGLAACDELPDAGTTTYTYDPAGHLLTATNANGVTSSRSTTRSAVSRRSPT